MPGRDEWMAIAAGADAEELRDRILTGYKDGKPFSPYVPTLTLPAGIGSVLDFGCGLGRNFPYLKQVARTVAGFDLPPMIERCRASGAEAIDLLSADWDQLKVLRFDLIVASLVLQHIEPMPLRMFLRDFSRMSPALYVLTRAGTDFGENVFEVVRSTELFAAGECVEVEHDPATHQLRPVRSSSVDEARDSGPERHFEVLLRSVRS
jgi:SAM-dependent methyltransferase